MVVVGPTGNRVRLPATTGRTYPGYGIVVQRSRFDATLQQAAIAAGAEFFESRADDPISDHGRLAGFTLSSTGGVRADAIIGADGATSHVAEVTRLVEPGRVLWASQYAPTERNRSTTRTSSCGPPNPAECSRDMAGYSQRATDT
jgi:flavin-dependent dehydrogenase